jgi:hypothetical protein
MRAATFASGTPVALLMKGIVRGECQGQQLDSAFNFNLMSQHNRSHRETEGQQSRATDGGRDL